MTENRRLLQSLLRGFSGSVVFINLNKKAIWLVVSTPLKNISQIGLYPQVGLKIKNI